MPKVGSFGAVQEGERGDPFLSDTLLDSFISNYTFLPFLNNRPRVSDRLPKTLPSAFRLFWCMELAF